MKRVFAAVLCVLLIVLTACNTVPDKKLISQIDSYYKRNGFDY